MTSWPKSQAILNQNEKWIPGGVVSLNRKSEPNICFSKGRGSRVWDVDGNEYIDYQAGFAAAFLGHNDPDVNDAVRKSLDGETVLMGAGPTDLEGQFAELFCRCVPTVEKIEITTTGSEATYHAIPPRSRGHGARPHHPHARWLQRASADDDCGHCQFAKTRFTATQSLRARQ